MDTKDIQGHSFTDSKGRVWPIRITVKSVRDVKLRKGIDLRELVNDECKPFLTLISDAVALAETLFIVCGAEAHGLSEDEFCDLFHGDVSENAANAFGAAFVDFFPNPQLRKSITELLGLVRELRDEIVEAASTKVTEAIESTDKASIVKSIEQQASSESIPTRDRCENCSGCSTPGSKVHSETLKSHCESRYRAMANIMALIEAVNTGKRVHPDKFYSGHREKRL